MKKLSFILFVLFMLLLSCNSDDSPTTTQEEDTAKLDKMHQEIIELSGVNSQLCTDPNDWAFIGIASKACGGYGSYIAYSKKIDTKAFLEKVKAYTNYSSDFNQKWNIPSPCNIIIPPTGVKCIDNKPQLSYDPVLH